MHTGMYSIQAATSKAGTGYMQVEAGAVYINKSMYRYIQIIPQ
jgi:hypothetical protein